MRQFKFGLDPGSFEGFEGRPVRLRGTLIYQGNQKMIEVVEGSLRFDGSAAARHDPPTATAPVRLGEQTFVGEIVDSKCYLGVMNPGVLTPHRACAIRCISGGVPPVLLVRRADAPAVCLFLVSRDGRPVNRQVLDWVAEPVEITGQLERQGEQLVLCADPATYRRPKPQTAANGGVLSNTTAN